MALRLIPALALALALAASSRATAQHLRFELASGPSESVPATFDELRARVVALGTITWEDAPYFDPYAASGGATYASITFDYRADSVTVTWTQFADAGAASSAEREFLNSYGPDGWVRFARDGRVMLQVYSNGGVPESAGEALTALLGG